MSILVLLGRAGDELAALLADRNDGLTDPDATPEPPAEPVSVLGDVWLLGRHRLVCGDCTTVEAVDAALVCCEAASDGRFDRRRMASMYGCGVASTTPVV